MMKKSYIFLYTDMNSRIPAGKLPVIYKNIVLKNQHQDYKNLRC